MVYLFLGEERFLKNKARQKLISKLFGSRLDQLNYKEFSAGEDNLSEMMDYAKTLPFMAKYRLVVIKEVNRLNPQEKETLVSFIANRPRSLILVLEADSLAAQDPVYKIVKKHGRSLDFDPLQGANLYKWISDRFSSFNKRIQKDAVKLLVNNIGSSLEELDLTIQMLTTFVGEAEVISPRHIEEVTGKNLDASTEKLFDAIGYKDADSALRILESLDKDQKTVAMMVGLIRWHLWRVWRAKKLANQRLPMAKVAMTVGVRQNEIGSFLKQMNNFSSRELENAFKVLLNLDRDIKTTGAQAWRALELLVLQLCGGSLSNPAQVFHNA